MEIQDRRDQRGLQVTMVEGARRGHQANREQQVRRGQREPKEMMV